MTTTATPKPGATLTHDDAADALAYLGFTVATTQQFAVAVGNFQAGWNLGVPLVVDRDLGPKTSTALAVSAQAGKAGRPTASEHFSFAEFACHCEGRMRGCAGVWVRRHVLAGLETYRLRESPGGVTVVSGCRCAAWNAAIPGAAEDSQHVQGDAADIDKVTSYRAVAALGVFSGVGYGSTSHLVRHVDTRGLTEAGPYGGATHNATRGTLTAPTEWVYEKD